MATYGNPWTTGGGAGYTIPYSGGQVRTAGGGSSGAITSTKKTKTGSGVYDPANEIWTEATDENPWSTEELESQLSIRDKYNQAAEARRAAMIQGLWGQGGAGGAGTAGQIGFNEQGARAAAFARAKDTAGQTSRAALDSLRNALSTSGRLGGDFEAQQTAGIIGGAAGELGEFEREQLIQDLGRAGQISDRERAAQLTMRGQDIQRQAALLGLFNATGAIY